jgi:DNA polymerase-4
MDTEPKQMRKLWRSVTGERLWYALHGYEIQATKSERSMYGHGRVLPPKLRNFIDAKNCSRLLLIKLHVVCEGQILTLEYFTSGWA